MDKMVDFKPSVSRFYLIFRYILVSCISWIVAWVVVFEIVSAFAEATA
jgi:hypothetical protein